LDNATIAPARPDALQGRRNQEEIREEGRYLEGREREGWEGEYSDNYKKVPPKRKINICKVSVYITAARPPLSVYTPVTTIITGTEI
jgi:hypothetical protein